MLRNVLDFLPRKIDKVNKIDIHENINNIICVGIVLGVLTEITQNSFNFIRWLVWIIAWAISIIIAFQSYAVLSFS